MTTSEVTSGRQSNWLASLRPVVAVDRDQQADGSAGAPRVFTLNVASGTEAVSAFQRIRSVQDMLASPARAEGAPHLKPISNDVGDLLDGMTGTGPAPGDIGPVPADLGDLALPTPREAPRQAPVQTQDPTTVAPQQPAVPSLNGGGQQPASPQQPATAPPPLPADDKLPEPGKNIVLDGAIVTVNPDRTIQVAVPNAQTGGVNTTVYDRFRNKISDVETIPVPGTGGRSVDTVVISAQGTTRVRSVLDESDRPITWTANPDGSHSVQYPGGLIIKEPAPGSSTPAEIVQLTPDGLGGHIIEFNLDGTISEADFWMGALDAPVTDITNPNGSHTFVATVPGQTNSAPLSIITHPDRSRVVLNPDGTTVPIDRYNNAIGGPNYANQFDPRTATWRSDPFIRRGLIITRPDGTTEQEWFYLSKTGEERSGKAQFDTNGYLSMLDIGDYTGSQITSFETFDGITLPTWSGYLDAGVVKDESTLIWELLLTFTGVGQLGLTAGRMLGARLIANQLAARGVSQTGIELTLSQLGPRGATTFTGLAGAGNRVTRPITAAPVVYAPTGMWDAAITIGDNAALGIRAGINRFGLAAAGIKNAMVSSAGTASVIANDISLSVRSTAARVRSGISTGAARVGQPPTRSIRAGGANTNLHGGGRAGIDRMGWEGEYPSLRGKQLDKKVEGLRQSLLKSNDDLRNIQKTFGTLGIRVNQQTLQAVKIYNFDSRGLQFQKENYLAWLRLASGKGTIDDVRYLIHEIAEIRALWKIQEHTGFDFMKRSSVRLSSRESIQWALDFDRYYKLAHSQGLWEESKFLSKMVRDATGGQVRINPATMQAIAPKFGNNIELMLVDGVPLSKHHRFIEWQSRKDTMVTLGDDLAQKLGYWPGARVSWETLVGNLRVQSVSGWK